MKDIMNLKKTKAKSYWIKNNTESPMKKQF